MDPSPRPGAEAASGGPTEVKIAVVVGKPDKADDEVPCAHLVLQEDYSHRQAEVEKKLRLLCQQHLSDYQVPVQWYFHQSLPLTANGKIDYRFLKNYHE